MDINQQHKIQCFNCHADIVNSQQEENNGPICQECLNAHSSQIANLQAQNQLVQQMVNAVQGDLMSQLAFYRGSDQQELTLQQLQKELNQLWAEQQQLREQDQQISQQLANFQHQFQQANDRIDHESDLLCLQQVSILNSINTQQHLNSQIAQLQQKRTQLQSTSVLNELYSIHFDDNFAYVNKEPINYGNCNILVQIFAHVCEVLSYKEFRVDFARNVIVAEKEMKIDTSSPEATVPWLTYLAKQLVSLTEYIRQQTEDPKNRYSMRFKWTAEGDIAVQGITLKEGQQYGPFLKLMTHELKIMMAYACLRLLP